MNEFKHSVGDALRYWEARRFFYNTVLMGVGLSWATLTWAHFRFVQLMGIPPGDTHPVLLIPIILAFLANVCYGGAYLVDIPLQLTFATWRKYRWALLFTGTFVRRAGRELLDRRRKSILLYPNRARHWPVLGVAIGSPATASIKSPRVTILGTVQRGLPPSHHGYLKSLGFRR